MRYSTGKRDPINKKSVAFEDFITAYPSTPIVDTAPNYNYPMDGNDSVGDCVVAGYDHFKQVVTGLLLGTQQNLTQDEIWTLYKTQNPNFDPNSTTNGAGSMYDNGMDIQTFLEYLTNNKYILGFGRINWTKRDQMQAAIYMGLSIITGVQLRDIQHEQFNQGTWDFNASSPIEGGHCIVLHGYQSTGYKVITWGKMIDCTDAFILNQMDEAWFVLTQEHVNHPNFRNHFDLQAFSDAVKAITDGKIIIPVPPVRNLYLTSPMMHGDDVKEVQRLLVIHNQNIVIDGWFGTLTKTAVVNFQSANNLVPDGIVGKLTCAVLRANS